MRVDIAPGIMAGEDGVEIGCAPLGRSIRARQPPHVLAVLSVLLRVAAHSISLPDVHPGALERLAGIDVDDLQRQTLVDALLILANVLPVLRALLEIRAPDVLGREDARGEDVALLVAEERVVVLEVSSFALGRHVVVDLVPLLDVLLVCGVSDT